MGKCVVRFKSGKNIRINRTLIMIFVFRNNTIEQFFTKEYVFSGYEDVSNIPDADSYLWFYQQPIQFNNVKLAEKIRNYLSVFSYVINCIPNTKMIVAMTMVDVFSIKYTDDDNEVSESISEYNTNLRLLTELHSNLKVLDFSEFTKYYAAEQQLDWKYFFISQMVLNPKLSISFKQWWAEKQDALLMKRRKCLVLDLDNTLWGGILGEDGVEGIKIGGGYPGNVYQMFQEIILEMKKMGVLLVVCSKNNEYEVWDAFEKNSNIVLNRNDFAAWRINWIDKATNIRQLQKDLNIGFDSMVFIDDNPVERDLVKQQLPDVIVPDFPSQPYELISFAKSLIDNYFKVYSVTKEDLEKTKQYKENALREQVKASYSDLGDYIRSLEIKIRIEEMDDISVQRVSQMTQKTNQFNLTTKRYSESEVRMKKGEGWHIYTLSVSDKYGDYGMTGCMMIKGNEIDEFLLSCRILGKEIETAFAKSVLKILKGNGVRLVKATFVPTLKNAQVENFYDKLGFSVDRKGEDGVKEYVCDLKDVDLSIKDYYTIAIV